MKNSRTYTHVCMHSIITPDLILIRQTVPAPCKVCHRAINLLRKEHVNQIQAAGCCIQREVKHTPTRKSF